MATQHTLHGANHLGLLEARDPWGPWRTVAYTTLDEPAEPLPPSGFFHNFLANSFSEDGTRFTLAYTGGGRNDALVLVDGAFALNPAAR